VLHAARPWLPYGTSRKIESRSISTWRRCVDLSLSLIQAIGIPVFKMPAVDRPRLIELDQRSVPGLLCCFSLSVSRSPSACHKVAACVLEIAIRIRVSRSTDDLASLVPRNVMRVEGSAIKTDAEVLLMQRERAKGRTKEQAAASAEMSVRSLRSYERGARLPNRAGVEECCADAQTRNCCGRRLDCVSPKGDS
jgi:hypothetical protein